MTNLETKIANGFDNLIEQSKTDRRLLVALKIMALRTEHPILAADLREFERIHFPDTREIESLREKANLIMRVFEMAGMQVEEKTCMKVHLVMNLVNELGVKSSIDSVTEINQFVDNIYPES